MGDLRIQEATNYLGDDLEQMPDGDCVLLRRRSSHLIPTFCIYGLSVGDLTKNQSIQSEGWQELRIDFDD
jgi:hypothetical protein